MSIRISPSLAAGDILNFAQEVKKLEKSGADALHIDVMDGHFVPLLTLGVPFVEALKKLTLMELDVHIMVTNPDASYHHYLQAGATTLTFHQEAALHHHRIIEGIKTHGAKAGIALNPGTPWQTLIHLLPFLDQVTLMSVNPGFSRQKHIEEVQNKLSSLHLYCQEKGYLINLQIDGGVNAQNAFILQQKGATDLVAGGAVMGSEDYQKSINNLKNAKAFL